MKKFIVYLLVIILAVSLGFAVFYLVRDNEVISISSASIYKDAGESFQIDVNHQNKKSYTTITISTSNADVVSYNKDTNTFKAENGGVARINFRTSNAKFRNLWCDVIVGDGTIESPYYISSPEQLASIGMGVYDETTGAYLGSTKYNKDYAKYSSDKCYKIVNDIDLKDINEGYWIPLREFSGRFDGNGFTIRNMNIDYDNYTTTFKDANDYDPTLFAQDNVGMFQKISATGLVYNFKLANVSAYGKYNNFGVITAENKGTIERVEVEDAYLSLEIGNAFGGLVAYNITTEQGENDTYIRNIARIDRCSINMVAGKRTKIVDDEEKEYILGMNGIVGGLIGVNQGGTLVYSYAQGEICFASDKTTPIIYGGIVGENTYIALSKFGGSYSSTVQGANIKDCYSDLITNFDCQSINGSSLFAGAIARNIDYTDGYFDDNSSKEKVQNYLVGIYYNKDNLNAEQEGITKNYSGIETFKYTSIKNSYNRSIDFVDTIKIVYGLSEEEMKVGDNYISHTTDEIQFDENGVSQGIEENNITWLFGSVWAMDSENNDGKPYLNYQLIYIPDDFITAGTPIILNYTKYTFEKAEVESAPVIVSGTNGVISMQKGQTYEIKVNPAGLKYTWTSSDASIASVSDGIVTANKEGRVSITVANKSGITDSITVIVTDPATIIYGLPTTDVNLEVNKTYELSPSTYPSGVSLTYISSNTGIASVDSTGKITAKSAGSCYVYVKANYTVEIVKVNVYEDTSTKIATVTMYDNGTYVVNGSTVEKTYSGTKITGKITANITYNGTTINNEVSVQFTSTNSNILAIDSQGNYTINGSGQVYIIVSIPEGGKYVATAGLKVVISEKISDPVVTPTDPEPTEQETLTFNYSSYSLYVGQTFTIVPQGTSSKVHYSMGDSSIANINTSTGVVTAKKAGTTRVIGYIIRSDGSTSYAYCTVNVLETLTFNYSSYSLYVGQSFTIVPQNVTSTVHYSVGDSSIASVNTNGLVTANKAGTTRVTGYIIRSDNSYSYAYCTVVVMDRVQKTISISPSTTNAVVGDTINFSATLTGGGAGDTIYWSTTGGSLNTTSGSQVVLTVNSAGTINVTATSGSVSATASVVVTDANVYSKYIYNANQLNAVRNYPDKQFVLANNIDLSGWDWVPIGTSSKPFTGSIENSGSFTISNMNVSSGYDYAGLFGYASSANIKGIRISNSNVQGKYVGAVLGYGTSVKIANCVVSSSTLTGTIATGGIVGRVTDRSAITNCTVSGSMQISTISGANSGVKYVGGIVGEAYKSSTISYAYVSMSGSNISLGSSTYGYAGGIVGQTDGNITNVSVQANISANSSDNDYAGGIVGYTSANITNGVIKNTSIKGGYAGGIGGTLSHATKISIYFSSYKDSYRYSDISSSSYSANISKVAVKDSVTITGCDAGGLFGIIKNGCVKDCYTRAKLCGLNSSAYKAGFASVIESTGLSNTGGYGYVGIVENCYSACTFDSKGKTNFSITQSYVHNYSAQNTLDHGFCFNYVFDNTLDGNATYYSSGNLFAKDKVQAKKSSAEMKQVATYTEKGFSAGVWNLNGDYPTLLIESSL